MTLLRWLSLGTLVSFCAAAVLADTMPARHSSGRILGTMPEFTRPVLFNTPEADQILAALQVFPADNPWNEDISRLPVQPRSQQIIAAIGASKRLAYNLDMCFILVPP